MIRSLKLIFVLIMLISFYGCASKSYPPPYFDDKRYVMEEYNISFDVPDGWTISDEIPAWLNDRSKEDTKDIKAVLVNKERKGMILISIFSTPFDIQRFKSGARNHTGFNKGLSDGFYEKLRKKLEKNRKSISDDSMLKEYIYNVNSRGVLKHPPLIATVNSLVATELIDIKEEAKSYLYGCMEDDSCISTISLVSPRADFYINYIGYMSIIESLKI